MARIRYIRYHPHRCKCSHDRVEWAPQHPESIVKGLPQIVWESNSPWREANLWALQRATERDVSIETVRSNTTSLLQYANWLEDTGTDWWDFPVRKADRCLVRYRGFLIACRDIGTLAPSTTSQRMRDVINFYRWLRATELISPNWPMWNERSIGIRLADAVGFERTISIQSTDLAIRNRTSNTLKLEDGLLPVSAVDRDSILHYAKDNSSWELYLFLMLGFYTGMRIGTLCDLKVETLQRAIQDEADSSLYRLAIGPGAYPRVATKFGVTGHAWITKPHLEILLGYAHSQRRMERVAKALPEEQNILFLTRFGNRYSRLNTQRSNSLNVEMHTLRNKGTKDGITALRSFHFHQTRCTFATQLAMLLIPVCGAIGALSIIRDALLHRDEATSLKYIKFVERTPAKAATANAFTRDFLGIASQAPGTTNGD